MAIIDSLSSEPTAFEFYQVLRLLEVCAAHSGVRYPLGEFVSPSEEPLRLQSTLSFGFATESIQTVRALSGTKQQWQVATSFMGFFGALGTLPYPYTEWMQDQIKHKNSAFLAFLECFHHRTVSLYYRAYGRYRLPLSYERARLSFPKQKVRCRFTEFLASLVGLLPTDATVADTDQWHPFLYFSAFYASGLRDKISLQKILAFTLGVAVAIDDFVGSWFVLDTEVKSRLTSNGSAGAKRLGVDFVIGERAWFCQSKVIVRLGPMTHLDAEQFLPGAKANRTLKALCDRFIGAETTMEYRLEVVRASLAKHTVLSSGNKIKLGRNLCLSAQAKEPTTAASHFSINI